MIQLDGKKVASVRRTVLKEKVIEYESRYGAQPTLAVVVVGDDPASHIYVKNKQKACHEVGIRSIRHDLAAQSSEAQVIELISRLNGDPAVHAILVQLPLPGHLSSDHIIAAISPTKDADGLTAENLGLLWIGKPRVIPCTPHGIIKLLEHYEFELPGKRAVVIGRSLIVGKPMGQLLLNANATVTVAHSKTEDLAEETRRADIVIVATGRPREFGKAMFKEGAIVVDVGIHRQVGESGEATLCGDVRFEELAHWAFAATPVPGGVGPMTISMLLENTIHLAYLSQTK